MEYLHWKLRRATRRLKERQGGIHWLLLSAKICKDGRRRGPTEGVARKVTPNSKSRSESQSAHLNFIIRIGSALSNFLGWAISNFFPMSSDGAGKALGNELDGLSTCSACIFQAC